MKTNSKADGKDKSSLYEESQETISKYLIPLQIIKRYAKKKIVYHHLRSRLLSHILFMVFFWIYVSTAIQIPKVFLAEKGMRELIANQDFTMPTSYVSHSKPSISKVKGVRFRLDDVRSIDAVWHFLDKVILKILYIDSTLTGYTSSQQGSSTGNISSIAGNGKAGNNSLGDYRVITPFYYFVWGLRLRQHRVKREQNLDHCRFVKQPADKVYKSETGGWLDENCVGKWKGEHSSERPGGSNASIVKS